jgi:hypothetical protein
VGNTRVTPEAQVLELRLPFGGFSWSRPSAVIVERDGQIERVRVLDLTRVVQLLLVVTTLVAFLITWRTPRHADNN